MEKIVITFYIHTQQIGTKLHHIAAFMDSNATQIPIESKSEYLRKYKFPCIEHFPKPMSIFMARMQNNSDHIP